MNELKIIQSIRNKKITMSKLDKLISQNKLSGLDLSDICLYQQLSEEFIDKHYDKLNWVYITIYQKFSLNFMIKHMNRIKWDWIADNPHINQRELEENEIYLIKKMMLG